MAIKGEDCERCKHKLNGPYCGQRECADCENADIYECDENRCNCLKIWQGQECPYFKSIEPVEDVAPVVHGWWMYNHCDVMGVCSKCGSEFMWSTEFNYCPHCGAKMDGGGR